MYPPCGGVDKGFLKVLIANERGGGRWNWVYAVRGGAVFGNSYLSLNERLGEVRKNLF